MHHLGSTIMERISDIIGSYIPLNSNIQNTCKVYFLLQKEYAYEYKSERLLEYTGRT